MILNLAQIISIILKAPLSKGRRLNAVINFAKLQIATRITGSRLVVNWVNEAKLIWRNGDKGMSGDLYSGLNEYRDMAFMMHYLRTSDEFYDIGANAGSYTVLASVVVGCKSYAHEPIPSTFNKLIDQVNINGITDKVELNNSGIGASEGVLYFTNSLDDRNHVVDEDSGSSVIEVETTTLDKKYKPQATSLVKVDVEGYEGFVIDGGKDFFSNPKVKVVILELNGSGMRFGNSDISLDKKMIDFGFHRISYDPPSREITTLKGPNTSGNTIYVRDITDAKRRCSSADRVVVHTAGGALV